MHYLYRTFTAIAVLLGLLAMQPVYAATHYYYSSPSQGQQQEIPQGSASLNWAGYVAQQTSAQYTSVTGTWTVPTVTVDSSDSADASWVGIGGVSSDDLIQAGTQAIVQNGSVVYNAWVETLPSFAQTVNLSVEPGDSITTTLTQTSQNVWQVTIRDNTTAQQYSTQMQYTSSLSSAEWVEEMVSNGNGSFRPLDTFGTVNFTGGSTVVNGQTEDMSQAGAQPLSMINGAGQSLATTSALGADGASFSVARTTASAIVPRSTTGRWHVVPTATSTGGQPTNIPTTSRHHRTTSGTPGQSGNGFSQSQSGNGFGQGGFGFGIPGFNLSSIGLPQQVTQLINQNFNQIQTGSSSSSPNTKTYQVGNWTIQITQF